MNIALKEADETAYWLELLFECKILSSAEFDSLYNSANELISMLTATIKTLKNQKSETI